MSRSAKGKVNTITKEQFMSWTKSIWTMNAESARKVGHPAPFPEELPYRLIQLYSFKNDIVLDPFIGSGTTGIAALKSERKFVGYDINEDYVKLAKKRLSKIINQHKLSFDTPKFESTIYNPPKQKKSIVADKKRKKKK